MEDLEGLRGEAGKRKERSERDSRRVRNEKRRCKWHSNVRRPVGRDLQGGGTLSTSGLALSSRALCGLDMTMTPSVIQSSGGCLRRTGRSPRPMPSFPCSSSISRSCELLLFTMMGPILRRSSPSLYMGCTLEDSLVRRMTDFSCKK